MWVLKSCVGDIAFSLGPVIGVIVFELDIKTVCVYVVVLVLVFL